MRKNFQPSFIHSFISVFSLRIQNLRADKRSQDRLLLSAFFFLSLVVCGYKNLVSLDLGQCRISLVSLVELLHPHCPREEKNGVTLLLLFVKTLKCLIWSPKKLQKKYKINDKCHQTQFSMPGSTSPPLWFSF